MAEISKPDYRYVWASGGANVLPSTTKIQIGWTSEVPPYRWENAIQNRQDNILVHICDNRKCINPEHLFLGTRHDNTQDMLSKGRHFTPFKDRTPYLKDNPEKAKKR